MISKGELAKRLSKLKTYESSRELIHKSRLAFEQYSTDSEIAASIIWNALQLGDINGKEIADLGAGTGILGIGALLEDAKKVFFVEKDEEGIRILKDNLKSVDEINKREGIFFGDVLDFKENIDVAITNPPFGTKKKHADLIFLDKACEIAKVGYSLHKSETLEYIEKYLSRKGRNINRRWDFMFPLKASLDFHKARIYRIKVSCIRF